jgi:multimeric flavodoxin WrbA
LEEVADMRVIVINGSPKMDKGSTAVILAPFMEGMREAGAEVEVFYTKKLKIRPCQGEYSCWLKTPGVCFQHDDMDWLRPKLGEGDIHVIATPLYFDGIPGSLKNFIDRLTPGALPLIPQETYVQMVNQKFRQALATLSGHDLADVHST